MSRVIQYMEVVLYEAVGHLHAHCIQGSSRLVNLHQNVCDKRPAVSAPVTSVASFGNFTRNLEFFSLKYSNSGISKIQISAFFFSSIVFAINTQRLRRAKTSDCWILENFAVATLPVTQSVFANSPMSRPVASRA